MEIQLRQRRLRLLFGLFLGLLIVFTLFSNTLMALTLPKVVLTTVSRGQLTHTYTGTGIVRWKQETPLMNSAGWKVNQVQVKEGDLVSKGQTLVTYHTGDAEQQLLDEQASMKKQQLSMEELQHDFIEASQAGDEKRIEDAKRALDLAAIDLDVQDRRVQKLQEALSMNSKLIAPFDGKITKVNAVEGLPSAGGPDVVISNGGSGFEFDFLTPADAADRLEIGEKLDVEVTGTQARRIEGRIEAIQDSDTLNPDGAADGAGLSATVPMKRLLVTLQEAGLQGGERVKVELTNSTDDVILVPNQAIHDEGGKKYVLGVEERNGPIGNAFYVHKKYITVADSDGSMSAVVRELFDQEQIIAESSEPLQEGDKIRM